MPRALRAGFDTHWTTFGQGPRDALMIHCTLASGGSWGGMARHLSGALTMAAFDLPGHGRSAEWDDTRGEFQALSCAIAASFAEAPLDIVGHSFGATVALRLAMERPDLVRSLVLIEPVCFAVAYHDRPDVGAAHDALMRDFQAAMAAQDFRAAAQAFTGVWGGGRDWTAMPRAQQDALADRMPLVWIGDQALYGDAAGVLAGQALEAVDMPVLLIEGSQSPAIIRCIHDGLSLRLPNAECAMVMGAGHMLPMTHPKQVSAEVLRFVQGATQAGVSPGRCR